MRDRPGQRVLSNVATNTKTVNKMYKTGTVDVFTTHTTSVEPERKLKKE